jgi:hypothetical protein
MVVSGALISGACTGGMPIACTGGMACGPATSTTVCSSRSCKAAGSRAITFAAAVHKAYGADRPQYAYPLVGGINYPAGTHQPALRHVTNLGADGLFIEGASAPAADGFTVVSAPSRPSLLSRLLGRFRRPR